MKRVNAWVAQKLSSFMATMFLFWILLIVDTVGAIFDPPSNLQGWLLWGVSILFQSVALPILAIVSNAQGDRMERKLNETHDKVFEVVADIHKIAADLHDKHIGGREHLKIDRKQEHKF